MFLFGLIGISYGLGWFAVKLMALPWPVAELVIGSFITITSYVMGYLLQWWRESKPTGWVGPPKDNPHKYHHLLRK